MKKKIIVMLILIAIVLTLIITLLLGSKKTPKKTIIGTWTTDGVTIYKFNKDNTGALVVPLHEYKFTYTLNDNTLVIDFENEKSVDATYTYSFDDNKLILEGDNGKYTFIKKEWKNIKRKK